MNRKPLTAHRLLEKAEILINDLLLTEVQRPLSHRHTYIPVIQRNQSKNQATIKDLQSPETEADQREGASAIPIDVLQQKLLLHRGLIFVSQGSFDQAKQCFVSSIQTGVLYDPRIRLECCKQLRQILQRTGI